MATFDELKQKLESSESYSRRREAVQALAQMANQRDRVVPLLKERLAVDDDNDVIEAIVEALAQMDALDDNVFRVLKDRISDSKPLVRRGVIRGLAKFQPRAREVVSLLKERLATDENPYVIRDMIKGLHQAGMTIEQMSRILARNPHFPKWSHREWHDLWNSSGIVRQVVEHTLRQRWWRLPADFRRSFGPPWFLGEPWHHHCPECEMMWHHFVRLLERGGGRRQEAEWLIASMGRWWGSPRWHFARHDFEQLMSLRVEQNVIYEEQNVLRFRYLDAFATDRQGRPISEQAPKDWGELLSTEAEFDRVRDEISDLKRQQEDIIREAERQREGRALEPGEPLPQNLQGRWNEIAERLRRLEGDVEPGEFQRLSRPLEEATEKLLPHLRQRGVRFKFVEIEGVLGEYNFYERKVTLYPPMIELAAEELSTQLHRSRQEVYDDLYTITEMHETAHATTHLGIDSNGRLWEQPEQGASDLHELLAQFYTIQLIRRMKDNRLEQVFLKLNERQPERYRYWQVLKDVPLEMVRDFLTGKRAGWFRWDLLTLAKQAAEIVGKAMPLLRTTMSQSGQFQAFVEGLKPILKRLEAASTRLELGEAAAAFLDHCEAQPFVRSLLQSALPRGLHSAVYRNLLLTSTLVEGEPIKGPSLRLSIDQILAACTVALMQNDLVRRNAIVHHLRTVEELRALIEPEKVAEIILSQLPKEREKALEVVERLRKVIEQA
jgi:hypothetical protein